MSLSGSGSWGDQPVTPRDLVLFVIVVALLFASVVAGVWLTITNGGSQTAAAQTNSSPWTTMDSQQPGTPDGAVIFQEKCVSCHTIGSGDLVGPDLSGVTANRDADWLARWIAQPDQMLAEGDPIATQLLEQYNNVEMPNLNLTDAQVGAVIAYMAEQSGNPVSAQIAETTQDVEQPTTTGTTLAGDATRGQALFTGEAPLENGGPSCMSCHTVTRVAALGGGTLGPDLTHVLSRYGEAGLQTTLETLPFPTMQGVFAGRPLTQQEAADLYAYFAQADIVNEEPVSTEFVWYALGGGFLLLIAGHLVWNKRLNGVRKPLVEGGK